MHIKQELSPQEMVFELTDKLSKAHNRSRMTNWVTYLKLEADTLTIADNKKRSTIAYSDIQSAHLDILHRRVFQGNITIMIGTAKHIKLPIEGHVYILPLTYPDRAYSNYSELLPKLEKRIDIESRFVLTYHDRHPLHLIIALVIITTLMLTGLYGFSSTVLQAASFIAWIFSTFLISRVFDNLPLKVVNESTWKKYKKR